MRTWLFSDQIRRLIDTDLKCVVSKRIVCDGRLVGYMYMYRGMEVNEQDSGWRFLSGDEDEEYMNNPDNHMPVELNTIANYDTAVIPLLNSVEGSSYVREWETFSFIPE